ncbi:MAG TPA: Sec-independent protein translocase protein TatB [Pyrinomonadaceae bacterium]|nr:Sec-independent protein translocase protein TatB [Pyrinomonadaceae bacterium]
MFLFIFESIGTSELILIGIIALIFLGPRKLPQIAKTIGKTMADFRNTTNEFKATWQREVDFEEEARALRTFDSDEPEPTPIPRSVTDSPNNNTIAPPEIKQVDADAFKSATVEKKTEVVETSQEDALSDKRSWL